MRRAVLYAALLGVLPAGCLPRLDVSDGTEWTCSEAQPDCPEGLVCVTGVERCADPADACIVSRDRRWATAPDGDGCTTEAVPEDGVCLDGRCVLSVCGDGFADPRRGEGCDDGNTINFDGCTNGCRLPRCGDGIVQDGEVCDDGNDRLDDACPTGPSGTCEPARCGDRIARTDVTLVTRPGFESCDDGNEVDGDGCDVNCRITACGNGRVSPGEGCDDGNTVSGDGCDANCTPTSCGNGIATAGEECDDGNGVSGDGCDANCKATGCGNGVTTPGELCDDGNLDDGDGCDSTCTPTGCGNGVVTAGEECDDGNRVPGDECDLFCRKERRWRDTTQLHPGLVAEFEVTVDGLGNVFVVYEDGGIHARRYDAAAGTWGPAQVLSAAGTGPLSADAGAQGNALALWLEGPALQGREWNPVSTSWRSARAFQTGSQAVIAHDVGYDNQGNAVVLFTQSDGSVVRLHETQFDGGARSWSAPTVLDDGRGRVALPRITFNAGGIGWAAYTAEVGGDEIHACRYHVIQGWLPCTRVFAADGTRAVAELEVGVDAAGVPMVAASRLFSGELPTARRILSLQTWVPSGGSLGGTEDVWEMDFALDPNGVGWIAFLRESPASFEPFAWASQNRLDAWSEARLVDVAAVDSSEHLELAIDERGDVLVAFANGETVHSRHHDARAGGWQFSEVANTGVTGLIDAVRLVFSPDGTGWVVHSQGGALYALRWTRAP